MYILFYSIKKKGDIGLAHALREGPSGLVNHMKVLHCNVCSLGYRGSEFDII